MAIGIRDLKSRASEILRDVEKSGRIVTVTRHGKPTALILPIDSPEGEDYILSHSKEIVASLREAERDYAAGRTVPLRSLRRKKS